MNGPVTISVAQAVALHVVQKIELPDVFGCLVLGHALLQTFYILHIQYRGNIRQCQTKKAPEGALFTMLRLHILWLPLMRVPINLAKGIVAHLST